MRTEKLDNDAGWVVEKVGGPFRGYFFASYARAAHDGFHAYVKIFDRRPFTVWEAAARAKVTSHSTHSYRSALALAEARAMERVMQWAGKESVDVVLP